MPLSARQAVDEAKRLMDLRHKEGSRLENIREYIRDDKQRWQRFLPADVPREVREIANIARVNMLRFVVRAAVQIMYVDGFRLPREEENVPAWRLWQANQMDARQIGVHRAALTYGKSYVTVLPGDPLPVLRGVSPRHLTASYGDDDLWPELALERRRDHWRLYDNQAVYWLVGDGRDSDKLEVQRIAEHGAGVTPVVRYRETDDVDEPVVGVVEPLISLQDQINITTFGLLVAQHFGAFRQRYVIGWTPESDAQGIKVSASRLMAFKDNPADMTVGEFGQTALDGYINSRDATLRHLATVSQSSAFELLGQLVQMSAEALVAAQASAQRAGVEYKTVMGEAHEQMLSLGGQLMGSRPDDLAEVRWRDTESHSIAQWADALTKFTAPEGLAIPAEALWPQAADALGASQQQVETWKVLREAQRAEEALNQRLEQVTNQRSGQRAG